MNVEVVLNQTQYHDLFLKCEICKKVLWMRHDNVENGERECGDEQQVRRTIDVSRYNFVSSEKDFHFHDGKEHWITFANKIRYTLHSKCFQKVVKQKLSPFCRK